MKLRPGLIVLAALLAFAVAAGSLHAQTASFQGSTLGFSRNGDFRATGSSCPGGGTPSRFSWNFVEDGTTQLGNPVTHKFLAPFAAYTVTLTITCPGGTASSTRFVCFGIGVLGCVFPDQGYN